VSNDTPPRQRDHRYDLITSSQENTDLTGCVRRRARDRGFALDAAQERALRSLERVYGELKASERLENSIVRLLARKRVVRGVYLWGGVGRGKSFLMDGFCDCVPFARKRRIHFHRFMQRIHLDMRERQGQADPLTGIAREMARRVRLLCLDEFHITDITDAMLMRRLLEGLFERGVTLVTTSNFAPDELYRYGLQRNQFLPAIDLIEQNLEVIEMDGGTDYRLRELERAGVYHAVADGDARLAQAFDTMAGHEPGLGGELEIESRMIRVRREAAGVAWFEFHELCDGPRAKADYIELARRYHTVLLSGVPRFTAADADKLRRFVWLIDEFYDRRVKLMIAAAAPALDLIDGPASTDRFQAALNVSLKERLVSRLTEMQTRDYLMQPHLP
jgi:cell division protein ZapE